MKSILEDLYYGNINPIGRNFVKGGNYNKALNEVINSQEKLDALLQNEAKNRFDELCKAQSKLSCEEALNSFTCGFRLGAKIIIDIFTSDSAEVRSII